jgi:hypothetical protein
MFFNPQLFLVKGNVLKSLPFGFGIHVNNLLVKQLLALDDVICFNLPVH